MVVRWTLAVGAAIVCGISGLLRLVARLRPSRSPLANGDGGSSRSSAISVYLKKLLLVPALVGKTSSRRPRTFSISWSIPTRLETVLVVIYIAVNVAGLGIVYPLFDDNVYWPDDLYTQHVRYIADRSGVLAFA
jgi:hypothetical protein